MRAMGIFTDILPVTGAAISAGAPGRGAPRSSGIAMSSEGGVACDAWARAHGPAASAMTRPIPQQAERASTARSPSRPCDARESRFGLEDKIPCFFAEVLQLGTLF